MIYHRLPRGASALYFVAVSLAGSLAAFAGGAAMSPFGYAPALFVAGAAAMAAAFVFRALVRDTG
jgi:predicted MFS family arabinose efflux permease